MSKVEIWGYEPNDPSLVVSKVPSHRDPGDGSVNGHVINGLWDGLFDKEKNTVYIPYTDSTHPCYFIAEVDKHDGNWSHYEDIFKHYRK